MARQRRGTARSERPGERVRGRQLTPELGQPIALESEPVEPVNARSSEAVDDPLRLARRMATADAAQPDQRLACEIDPPLFVHLDVPEVVVTVMSTVPAVPAGLKTVICVAELLTIVAEVLPNLTAVALERLVPVIVTDG